MPGPVRVSRLLEALGINPETVIEIRPVISGG
jgi:sulfur carrier protein ThiS